MPPLSTAPAAEEVSDAALIARVRAGDVASYGTLFARHREAANRLARALTQPADADDVVADAFAKVLAALQDGKGPDEAFRPYLLTAVRTCHVDRRRFSARVTPTDDDAVLDTGTTVLDPAVAGFEGSAAVEAFRSLPERWQLVLWHLDVEGQKPAAVAPLLGMAPNAVSALAYRAREGLRQAYLQQHAAEAAREECRRTHELLGAAVRGGVSRRDRQRIDAHLRECRACTALYLELTELNTTLRAVLGPLVLGGVAAAYLTGTTGGTSVLAGASVLAGRARDTVAAHTQAALAAAVAGAAAMAAVTGMVVLHDRVTPAPAAQADAPVSIGSPTPGSRPRGPEHPASPASTAAHRSASSTAGGRRPGAGVPVPAALAPAGAGGSTATPSSATPTAAPRSPGGSSGGSFGTPGRGPSGNPTRPAPAPPKQPSSQPSSRAATLTVSAGLLRGGPGSGGAPVDAGLALGGVPAAHLAAVDADVAGQRLALALP
ncbi:MAG: zf-HC2 domain-containing protein [Marmoricola sp.]